MAASDISAAATATDFSQLAALRTAARRNDPQALHKAAQQFEALFTEMLLKSSDQTKFGDDLTGQQGEFYKDLYNQQMALHLSSGKGLGLADMLVRQLNGLHGGSTPPTHAPPPSSATGTTADAAKWQPKSAQEFIDAIRPHAEKAAAELGVPARALIAQAALETGWGQHMAKQKDGSSGLNLFGVKAQGSWTGASRNQQTSEYENGQLTRTRADFRSYSSIGAAFDDYVKVLKSNPRYADALRSGDVHGFAQALQKAGYATDPHYAQKLVKVAYGAQMSGSYTAPSSLMA